MRDGATFWDDDDVFERYKTRRHNSNTPNETLEKPIITELLGAIQGLQILDLGCGDGVFGSVITSCNKSRADGGQRQDWIVDDYFIPGPRSVYLFRQHITQYHRTIEDLFTALQQAGFTVEALRESRPQRAHFADETLYERRNRIPLFLIF